MNRFFYFSLFLMTVFLHATRGTPGRHRNLSSPIFALAVDPKAITVYISPELVNASNFHVQLYHRLSNKSCAKIYNLKGRFFVESSQRNKADFPDCRQEDVQCLLHWKLNNISGCYCAKAETSDETGNVLWYHTETACLSTLLSPKDPISDVNSGINLVLLLILVFLGLATVSGVVIALTCKKIGFTLFWHRRHNNEVDITASEKRAGPRVVFVVYHHDDSEHLLAVKKFTSMLMRQFNCEVIVDYACMDLICKDISSWVSNSIARSSAIIFVNSKGAYKWVRAHHINNWGYGVNCISAMTFLLTWRFIMADYALQNNYRKIFNVKFDSIDEAYLLKEVVPGRHFSLPNDLQALIQALACIDDNGNSTWSSQLTVSTTSSNIESQSLLT